MKKFLLVSLLCVRLGAAEPFFRPGDTVALIGGEDLVVAAEEGELETQLQLELGAAGPRLLVRSLAWEGDTVFSQPRELNYPPLEAQVQTLGATTLVLEFGQTESFAGEGEVAAFVAAYEKLLDRLAGTPPRRLALIVAAPFEAVPGVTLDLVAQNRSLAVYREAILQLAQRRHAHVIDLWPAAQRSSGPWTRDGVHLNAAGQRLLAVACASGPVRLQEGLRELVRQKNQLWTYYARPQNWAFLAGDRTNQPSSRDHLDPTKRWFPAEMELFIPLIEKLEAQITASAKAP